MPYEDAFTQEAECKRDSERSRERRAKSAVVSRNHLIADVETLERATGSLPVVDDNGHSDCPFSDELFDQKKKKEDEECKEGGWKEKMQTSP